MIVFKFYFEDGVFISSTNRHFQIDMDDAIEAQGLPHMMTVSTPIGETKYIMMLPKDADIENYDGARSWKAVVEK